MKRPLAVIGFSYTAALAVAFIAGTDKALLLAAVMAAFGILSLIPKEMRKNKTVLASCLSAAAALMMFYGFNIAYLTPCENLYGKSVIVTAAITDLPYCQYDRYYYRLEISETEPYYNTNHTTAVVSSKSQISIKPYDMIKAKVRFYEKGDESYYYHSIAGGVFLRGSIDTDEEIVISEQREKPLYYYALMIRSSMTDIINSELSPERAGFVRALLLGDKTGLTADQSEAFRKAGISHIIAVSGFHLSVLTQLMMLVLYFLTLKRKRAASLLCTVFVFMYMAVVGFSPSIVRAGIMQILFLMSEAIIAKTDSLNSLGLAALIICFRNPYSAVDPSFLLSFSATLGIILCSERMKTALIENLRPMKEGSRLYFSKAKKRIAPAAKSVISVVTVTISAMLFTTPIMLIYFKSFAVYSLLFNLLVSFAASMLIFCSALMVIFKAGVILSLAALPFAVISSLLTDYIFWVVSTIGYFPSPILYASSEFVPICLIISGSAAIVYYALMKKKKAFRLSVVTILLVFAAGAAADHFIKHDSIKVSVLDTGEGLSVILSDGNDTAVLSCGGSYDQSYSMSHYLEISSADKISYLLLLDKKASCSGYAGAVFEDHTIDTVQVYDIDGFKESIQENIGKSQNVIYCSYSDNAPTVVHWKKIDIHVIKTRYGGAVYFEINGKSVLLCESKTDCLQLPQDWRQPDYLIFSGTLTNGGCIRASDIILSDTQDHSAADLSSVTNSADKIYCTGGSGDIALRIYPDQSITIRRERVWLS